MMKNSKTDIVKNSPAELEQEVGALAEYIGTISWDDKSQKIKTVAPQHPLKKVYDALHLAKCGIDVIFAQREQDEVRVNEELEKAVSKANAMAVEAELASISKTQFLANMSHEIRTPMNGVLGMAELLLRTSMTAEQKEFVETIMGTGKNLLDIINDILDYSKIESGRLAIETRPFNLQEVITGVGDILRPKSDEKGLRLIIDYPEDARVWFKGDPVRLRQVVMNLTGNSIKFTRAGHVKVAVRVDDSEKDFCALTISVTDTGIGIDATFLDSIFERFTQVDCSATRKYGGTGLGLAISKQLVEMMGGTLEVKSTEGEGTTFFFSLKLAVAEAGEESTTKQNDTAATGTVRQNVRVLLVEDNTFNQKVAQRMLEKLGCVVDVAENGKAAIEKMNTTYDIVFMDCQMPVMNGFEAARMIRTIEGAEKNTHIPIVALSANAMPGGREECKEAGMDDFLCKPITMDEIRSVLVKYCPG